MGVSHHDPAYQEMERDFIDTISDYMGCDYGEAEGLMNRLMSIMNDYGAVSWT